MNCVRLADESLGLGPTPNFQFGGLQDARGHGLATLSVASLNPPLIAFDLSVS